MSDKAEEFVRWYIRFNGYFTVENFIVHAGDDQNRISESGIIGNYTETDVLGLRMPHSKEPLGEAYMGNHDLLLSGADKKPDAIIVEVKTGNSNKPNPAWKHQDQIRVADYVVRYFGFHSEEHRIRAASKALLERFAYEDEWCRIRLVVVAFEPNQHWKERGVTYITYNNIVDYLVSVRGCSWLAAGIGVASLHEQWPTLIRDVVSIANEHDESHETRRQKIMALLEAPTTKHLGGSALLTSVWVDFWEKTAKKWPITSLLRHLLG